MQHFECESTTPKSSREKKRITISHSTSHHLVFTLLRSVAVAIALRTEWRQDCSSAVLVLSSARLDSNRVIKNLFVRHWNSSNRRAMLQFYSTSPERRRWRAKRNPFYIRWPALDSHSVLIIITHQLAALKKQMTLNWRAICGSLIPNWEALQRNRAT